jgi:putative membrane protein
LEHFFIVLEGFWKSLPFLLVYFSISLLILFGGAFVNFKVTPLRDIELIRNGNTAAGIAFAGTLIGIAIPLSASLAASQSFSAVIIWGAAIVIIQLVCDRLIDVIYKMDKLIEQNVVSAAIMKASIKVSVGLLNAAAWG